MKTLVEYLKEDGIHIDEEGALIITELVLAYKLEKLKKEEPTAIINISVLENVLEWEF